VSKCSENNLAFKLIILFKAKAATEEAEVKTEVKRNFLIMRLIQLIQTARRI
jgi:hypothetical protein